MNFQWISCCGTYVDFKKDYKITPFPRLFVEDFPVSKGCCFEEGLLPLASLTVKALHVIAKTVGCRWTQVSRAEAELMDLSQSCQRWY